MCSSKVQILSATPGGPFMNERVVALAAVLQNDLLLLTHLLAYHCVPSAIQRSQEVPGHPAAPGSKAC